MLPAQDAERRRKRLGLTRKRLAELAQVDENTLGRFLNSRGSALTSTVGKIEKALRTEEARLLASLREEGCAA